MTSKIIKVRKNHNCDQCTGLIHKGELALFDSWKSPRYDTKDIHRDNQIGIEYNKCYMCETCINRGKAEYEQQLYEDHIDSYGVPR